ncbi:18615_t:CDS:1, partial [Gigaspora rosea]
MEPEFMRPHNCYVFYSNNPFHISVEHLISEEIENWINDNSIEGDRYLKKKGQTTIRLYPYTSPKA